MSCGLKSRSSHGLVSSQDMVKETDGIGLSLGRTAGYRQLSRVASAMGGACVSEGDSGFKFSGKEQDDSQLSLD